MALYYISGPTDSPWYQAGFENLGPDISRMGVDVDGAFADYVTRPLNTLVPVAPELDPAQVAVATGKQAKAIHKIGEHYESVDETLAQIGYAPNRQSGERGIPLRRAA